MRLGSDHGASVELELLSYEYPRVTKRMDEWSANWLDVFGRIRLADGRTWEFTDPCLTTFEAAELGSWLRGISHGDESAHASSDTHPGVRGLSFTEPLLAFEVQPRSDSALLIGVTLQLGALPPWELRDEPIGDDGFVVTVAVTRQDIDRAGVQWAHACARFPER